MRREMRRRKAERPATESVNGPHAIDHPRQGISREASKKAVIGQLSAKEALAVALAKFPDLTPEGLRWDWDPDPHYQWHAEQIETAAHFLSQCRKNKRANFYSCNVKHWAEAQPGCNYVINGAAIVAAVALGFKVVRSKGGLYARIGINKDDVARLIGPKAWWRS